MSTDIENVAEYLPNVVHEMVNIAGFSDVEKIIKRFGGSRFRFSDGIHYFPKLKELIGKESAIKLRTHFQSEEIYIPRCDVALRVLRNQRLKADFDYLTQREGKSGRMSMLEICHKITVYAVEYEVSYDDIPPLEDGLFPEATSDKTSPDYVFNAYEGMLSEQQPMLEQVVGKIVDPTTKDFVEFNVETQKG